MGEILIPPKQFDEQIDYYNLSTILHLPQLNPNLFNLLMWTIIEQIAIIDCNFSHVWKSYSGMYALQCITFITLLQYITVFYVGIITAITAIRQGTQYPPSHHHHHHASLEWAITAWTVTQQTLQYADMSNGMAKDTH